MKMPFAMSVETLDQKVGGENPALTPGNNRLTTSAVRRQLFI